MKEKKLMCKAKNLKFRAREKSWTRSKNNLNERRKSTKSDLKTSYDIHWLVSVLLAKKLPATSKV